MKNVSVETRKIPQFDGYVITSDGQVFSSHNAKKNNVLLNGTPMYQMKHRLDHKGYYKYSLRKNGKSTSIFEHRLVAMAWIPNPNHYPIINHLDCNPKNNDYRNLEWCTYQRNSDWKFKCGYTASTKQCDVYYKDQFVKSFPTPRSASLYICEQTGSSERNVQRRMHYGDYKMVIPENGDTKDVCKSKNHHYETTELKRPCSLFYGTKQIAHFNAKQDLLHYCKQQYGSWDGLRRNNYSTRLNLFVLYDDDNTSITDFIKQVQTRPCKSGQTSKRKGFLYKDHKLIGTFQSIHAADLFCKKTFDVGLSVKPPYRNLSLKLLFSETELTEQDLTVQWKAIQANAKRKHHSIW